MSSPLTIGVLALQGDFAAHGLAFEQRNVAWKAVRSARDLQGCAGLVLPGGESSVLLKLSGTELREAISTKVKEGTPTLATCAGLIFIAQQVSQPAQESLQLLDVDVIRNAYGRQVDSFVAPDLTWTKDGEDVLSTLPPAVSGKFSRQLEGVFIRAPKISRLGKGVRNLAVHEGDPVLVKQGNIIGATFHPELSREPSAIHEIFLSMF